MAPSIPIALVTATLTAAACTVAHRDEAASDDRPTADPGGTGGSGGEPEPPRDDTGGGGGPSTAPDGAAQGGNDDDDGWWDAAWPRRRAVTVNLPERLEDVPLLLTLERTASDEELSAAQVRFVSADGQLLPHELDSATPEQLLLWVRVPDTSEPFWLYHGHPQPPALAATHGQDVWGDKMTVWHLGDGHESGPGGHAMEDNGASFVPGRIGLAFQGASASRANLALPRGTGAGKGMLSGATAVTLSAWVRPTDFVQLGDKPFGRQVLAVGTTKDDSNYNHAAAFLALGLSNDGNPGGRVMVGARPTGDEETATAPVAVPRASWSHIAAVVDLAQKRARLFVDGEAVSDWINMGDLEAGSFSPDHEAKSAHIGASAGGGYGYFDGDIDEVRLERTLRDETWLRGVYRNMSAPRDTVAFGPVQSRGP